MIVMPSNATGWFFHSLARETGKLGHLYSPRGQRGPWPWFPYALDNGAFACWDAKTNTFNELKWQAGEQAWSNLLVWASCAPIAPLWAIVPDTPGNAEATFDKWGYYAEDVLACKIPLALAVQDGMTVEQVKALRPRPDVICVGGSTEWKWETVHLWCGAFPRVHVLRCNSPEKLDFLELMGAESCDGTGWNRGDKKQTAGLERWARRNPKPTTSEVWPFTCRAARDKLQEVFA